MEFSTRNHSVDADMIAELDSDETSYGWLLSSPSTTAFSKMHLSTPRQLQTSYSSGSLDSNRSQKLADCGSPAMELQTHLFSRSDSDSSLSDTSFDEEHSYGYSLEAGILDSYNYKKSGVDESERIWELWLLDDDSPLQTGLRPDEKSAGRCHAQDSKSWVSDRFMLASLVSDNKTEECSKLYRSDTVRDLKGRKEACPLPPRVPPKDSFSSPPPSPPLKTPINYSHPQDSTWSTNTSFNATPPLWSPHCAGLSQIRTYHSSKRSICTPTEYPPRSSSMTADKAIYAMPLSPSFSLPSDDLMGKMQKSVFDWDSDDDDDDDDDNDKEDEKVELPEWIRKLTPKKSNIHKESFTRTTAHFAGKQKKKNKSFGALGEVFKRGLRTRRSGDF